MKRKPAGARVLLVLFQELQCRRDVYRADPHAGIRPAALPFPCEQRGFDGPVQRHLVEVPDDADHGQFSFRDRPGVVWAPMVMRFRSGTPCQKPCRRFIDDYGFLPVGKSVTGEKPPGRHFDAECFEVIGIDGHRIEHEAVVGIFPSQDRLSMPLCSIRAAGNG